MIRYYVAGALSEAERILRHAYHQNPRNLVVVEVRSLFLY